MGIQISAKQDYSILFSSLNSSSSKSSNSLYGINFADYASIKNGSYGKLLKAYYKQNSTSDSTSSATTVSSLSKTSVDATVKKELNDIQTYSNEVRDSAAALMEKGSKSVFKNEDMDKVYEAVSALTEDYNTLMEKGQASSSSSVTKSADSMAYMVKGYEDSLNEIGITIGKDNQLSIDKDTFMNADVDKVKSLFNGNSSLSYLISSKETAIGNTAYSESNKSTLYTANGTYSNLSTGDLLNGIV